MSRIGRKPIPVPAGVSVEIQGGMVRTKGPKGELEVPIPEQIRIHRSDDGRVVRVEPQGATRHHRELHGTLRALVANAVHGVSQGFEKKLEIHGVGYRAKMQGADLVMDLGFSHQVILSVPEGLVVSCPSLTQILIQGSDRQEVGQFAANVRNRRPPEPYKQKGIRYEGEQIKKKAGKTFVSGA